MSITRTGHDATGGIARACLRPLGILAVATLCGCAGATTQLAPERAPWTAENLYPLAEGNAWSYDVDSGDGDPVLAVSRVLTVTPTGVIIATGKEQVAYERRADGLFKPAKGAYLLKEPLAVGSRWSSGAGMSAAVVRDVASIETPAGQFSHCAEVEELHGDTGNHILTTYCPDVGPVRVVSEMVVRGHTLRVTALLRGYATHPAQHSD